MGLAVAKFNRTDLSLFGVKPEVVVQAPPIVTKPFLNLKTRCDFVVVARLIGDLDPRKEMGFSVGVVGFGEHPRQLEPRLNDDDRFIPLLQTDRGVEV